MRLSKCVQALLLLLPLGLLAGCSGSSAAGNQTGDVFTMATDAPLQSVVSCQLQVDGISLNGSPNLLNSPALVDFAQLSGLHQLLDLTGIQSNITYTSATITLDAVTPPVIQYINTSVNPPTISTLAGASLAQTSINVALASPFTLTNNALVGFRMEFDIAASLATNAGQLTGMINPTFHVALLNAADSEVSIDNFRAGFVGQASATSFVVQGPRGRQWTVVTSNATNYDTAEMPASYTTNSIIEISGQLDPVTKDIDATELAEISTDKFFLGGLFTSIRPAPQPGPASAADLYVRNELPAIAGLEPGDITTLTLNGTENYKIANVSSPLTNLLFSNSLLTAGQAVAVGGVTNTVNNVTTLIPHRIVLERQGQAGTVTAPPTITAGNAGSFQLIDNSPAGILLPSPLTVLTFSNTQFINLTGLSAVTGKIRVVGFILINPANQTPIMVARSVEQLTS